MELDLIIEILKLVVPTVIAVFSLYYAIRQRGVVKREISKKRYLERALSNLNETLKTIERLPDRIKLDDEDSDEWGEAKFLADDILRASFEMKKRQIRLNITYLLEDWGKKGEKMPHLTPRIPLPDKFEPLWLANFLLRNRDKAIWLETETEIIGFERPSANSPDSVAFLFVLKALIDAIDKLSTFEEVYDSLVLNSVENIRQIYATLSEELLKTIWKNKQVEINLDNFKNAKQVERFLLEEITSYSKLIKKFSEVSEVVSVLKEVRKELFSKVS